MFLSKRAKKLKEIKTQLKTPKSLEEVINGIKSGCNVKFIESIDLMIKLGTNPKKTDENIRGSFILPHGVPKKVTIAAFVQGTLADEAAKAGATIVGLEDLIEEIKKTEKITFDVCFASLEALPKLVPIAKILGKNGVMPNKKDGTVTKDIAEAIREVKSGKKCLFKNDDAGCLHVQIAKADMSSQEISENIKEFVSYIKSLKPPKVKEMLKKIVLSSTMGLGLELQQKFI